MTDDFLKQAREFDSALADTVSGLMSDDYAGKLHELRPAGLSIATITVSFETNMNFCDLTDVDSFESAFMPDMMSLVRPKTSRMLNSLTFKLKMATDEDAADVAGSSGSGGGGGRKGATKNASMMLFVNGAVNITGCKKVEDAYGCARIMCAYLDTKNGDGQGRTKIRTMNVSMINTNFTTATGFYLPQVHSVLVNKYKARAMYEQEVHPGVLWSFATSFKAKRIVTIVIFSSGNIIITGVVAPVQLKEAFVAVTQILNTEFWGVYSGGVGAGDGVGADGAGGVDGGAVATVATKKKRGRKCKSVSQAMEAKFAKLVC
jgi:TATA-box binding protein (TBP) (component of TFIID and TFIIIB)